MTPTLWLRARVWHALVFAVATGAVVLQLILVLQGQLHLGDTDPGTQDLGSPSLATRLVRFASYFTIWSNVLGAVTSGLLALDPEREGRVWRVARMNAVVMLLATAVVHWFFLRPLLDLHGADQLADRLLHMVVPLLVVAGWLAFGPRGRWRWADLTGFLVIPVVWLVYTLIRGAFVDWYPYPFIDVNLHGYPQVAAACLGVAVLTLGIAAGGVWLDSRLPWGRVAPASVAGGQTADS